MERISQRGKGRKMIHITTRFWTNDLPRGSDNKTAWASGVVYLKSDKTRRITSDMERFNNINEDYLDSLKKLLKRNKIKLIISKRVEQVV